MKTRADLMTLEGFSNLDVDTDGNPCVWENHYDSGWARWTDTWSCQCDDDGYQPVDSIWIGPQSEDLRALWESLPDAGSKEAKARA